MCQEAGRRRVVACRIGVCWIGVCWIGAGLGLTACSGAAYAVAAPTGLVVTDVTENTVTLDWDDNTEPDLAGYNVYRDLTSGFTPGLANRIAEGTGASRHSDIALRSSTTYYYVVTATCTTGCESAPSSEVSADTPNSAPIVSISCGGGLTAPADVTIAATVWDDGSVAKVEFYVTANGGGQTKLGEDTAAPFEFNWLGVGEGTYELTAVATDDQGAQTTSGAITVSVYSPYDWDADGVPDAWEVEHFGVNTAYDDPSSDDPDGDFLVNQDEFAAGTDPCVADTDGDGSTDGSEVMGAGTDPCNPDTDGDGLLDDWEGVAFLDPLKADADDDGVPDAVEDYDGDGFSNLEEFLVGSDPAREESYPLYGERDYGGIKCAAGTAAAPGGLLAVVMVFAALVKKSKKEGR